MTEHAVVIAGGGPTGLMLAGERALARVDVAIVERRASQDLAGSRAGGLHSRTIEILDQRGIADRFRPQRLAVGQLDVDASVVLRETGHLTSVIDRHRQLADPAGQYALDVVLPQPEPVVVPGGEVADVPLGPGESHDLGHLPLP